MLLKSALFLLLGLMIPLATYAQAPNLHKEAQGIRRVYVVDDPNGTPNEKAAKPLFEAELVKYGLVVSETIDEADAVLSGTPAINITIHGDRNSPPDRAIYSYRLLSRKNKVLWKYSFKFATKGSWLTNNTLGAQRIIERLAKDISESKRKR